MRVLNKFISAISALARDSLLINISKIEINPPDLVVYLSSNRLVLSRFLICRDVDYTVSELTEDVLRKQLDSYVALINSLPSNIHIYMVKEELDISSLAKRLANEIVNTQAEIDTVLEESTRLKLSVKLEKLKTLYSLIMGGRPFLRVSLVLVYRVVSNDLGVAKSMGDYYESIIQNMFKNMFGIKLERASYTDIFYLVLSMLGIVEKPGTNVVNVDAYKIASFQPVIIEKIPNLVDSLVVGYVRDTLHPVEIKIEDLFKHLAVIGPTGRGKTTMLAGLLEQLLAESYLKIIAIDFKGDLKRYISNLVEVLTPREAPITLFSKPYSIDTADWNAIIVEALSNASGFPGENIIKALIILEQHGEKGLMYPQASVLIPFIELLEKDGKPDILVNKLRDGNILIDVEGYGISYQNAYVAMCIGIIRHILLRDSVNNMNGAVLAIDDAWRVLNLKTLSEIIREGRSRKVGVILSTQNPSDIPIELLENMYHVAIFGSRNGEYVKRISRMLSIEDSVISMLPRLGVGEAVFANTITKMTKIIRTYTPSSLRSSSVILIK
ncbi:MAG: DUF87 domain-containing protein [Desulfurococcaceae archaeon]